MTSEGSAPAIIADHRYVAPSQRPWDRCERCGMAESAHFSAVGTYPLSGAYRCPYCVDRDRKVCEHEGAPLGIDGAPL